MKLAMLDSHDDRRDQLLF